MGSWLPADQMQMQISLLFKVKGFISEAVRLGVATPQSSTSSVGVTSFMEAPLIEG